LIRSRDTAPLALAAVVRGGAEVVAHEALADDDPQAANTECRPDRVRPRAVDGAHADGERVLATLPPRSWNVLRLRV
jgi:alpha-N-arabinofuranosidase